MLDCPRVETRGYNIRRLRGQRKVAGKARLIFKGHTTIRTNVKDRYYRVFTYQKVDRPPDIEFGYWPQTIRRWLKEGLPADFESERNAMFSGKLDAYFGFEHDGHGVPVNMGMTRPFAEEILERKEGSVVMRGSDGVVAERYLNDADDSSIPHYLSFPVVTPDDWAAVRERYDVDDPARLPTSAQIDGIRAAVAAGKHISAFFCGFYGQLRNWMGMENLSLAFYDYPEMVHDMVELWSEMAVRQLRTLPPDIPVDIVNWWEDMASKNGPLAGPALFREFLQPGYKKVMDEAKRRGAVLGMVDSDGNPHDLVANWMEEGVNIMFPLEVAAGVDPYAWRAEFGREMRIRGGIAKTPLVEGGSAIDKELERIRPLLDQGGYIPHLDHFVPPDIPLKNYQQYLEKKRKLIGR